MSVKIYNVCKNSPCEKKGIKPGDTLISVNGNEINDVLDYRFYTDEAKLKLKYISKNGHTHSCSVKNTDGGGDIGLEFETYLMDSQRHCLNHCIFCFVDQMPKGMRKTLYFKDDDSRLSFLFGNYITLTNLSEHDVERITKMHISPINVSVHTMNPELRVKMMKNPKAGESLKYLKIFSDAGITINTQLVLCPGVNDGEELIFSLKKLSELKNIGSVAAVPVGLTKFREGLYPLSKYTPVGAAAVIDTINAFNDLLENNGRQKLAFASDEFYQLAGRTLPAYEYYGDFPQLENGVGMLTLLKHDFYERLNEIPADTKKRRFAVATGTAAYESLKKMAADFCNKFSSTEIQVFEIENTFFGKNVTVAGLITGNEIITSLKKQGFAYDRLLLPSVMLKSADEPVFLDDVTTQDVERELNTEVIICSSNGGDTAELFARL